MSVDTALSRLPLSAEAVAEWSNDCDLLQFLRDLNDIDATMRAGGVSTEVNYCDWGDSLFENGKESFIQKALEFTGEALASKDAGVPEAMHVRSDAVRQFDRDATFGLMAKHAIAFHGTVDFLLSENGFSSLAHALEADEEVRCSVLLAQSLYYKQALQTLRGLLELSVLHVYFGLRENEFERWRSGNFRVPPMRGKEGLTSTLVASGVITSVLKTEIDDLYDALNGTIHSTEARLVHAGLFNGDWSGRQFRTEHYSYWCSSFVRATTCCMRLMPVILSLRSKLTGIRCDTCHRIETLTVTARDADTVSLRCSGCGSSASYAADYAAKWGF